MQRVRRAADVALALVVALCLSSVPAATTRSGGGHRSRRGCPLAALDPGRLGGPDRRCERIRRVRRDREPGSWAGRPDRSRTGLRDVVGLHGDAQGHLGGVDDPVARQADPRRQQRRILRPDRRRGLHGRVRRDGRGGGASGRGRVGRGRRRLGRCDEYVRRGRGRPGAFGEHEPRTATGRLARQRDRHERQRARLVRVADPGTARQSRRRRCRIRAPSRPDATAEPTPTPTAEPTPTSTPEPSVTPEPSLTPSRPPTPDPTPSPTPTARRRPAPPRPRHPRRRLLQWRSRPRVRCQTAPT